MKGLSHFFFATVFLTAGLFLSSAESATATGSTGLGLSSAAICLNIIYLPWCRVCRVFCPAFEIFD